MADWGAPKSRTPMVMLTEGLMQEMRDQVKRMGAPTAWQPGLSDGEIDVTFEHLECGRLTSDELRIWFRFCDGFDDVPGVYADMLGLVYKSLDESLIHTRDFSDDPSDLRSHSVSLNYQYPWFWVDQHGVPGEPSAVFGQFDNTDGPEDLQLLWPSMGTMVTDTIEALKVRRYDPERKAWSWEGRSVPGAHTMWDDVMELGLDPIWADPDYKGD